MIIQDVIARLSAEAMPPLRLVEGLAEFDALIAPPPDARLPAAYVLPGVTQAGANSLATGFLQRLEEPFSVIILHRNRRDARGAAASADLTRDLIPAVRRALIAWRPSADWDPVEIRLGRLIDSEDGVLAWRDDYTTTTHYRA